MARRIDRACFFLLSVVAGFLLFTAAGAPRALALALTALLASLIHACARAWAARYGTAREAEGARARAAQALVERWAIDPDEAAARAHLAERYAADDDYRFVLLARHMSARPLDANELLALWRKHAGDAKLVVAATGPVDRAAHDLAAELNAPRVRLLDAAMLIDAVKLSGLPLPAPSKQKKRRLRARHFVPSKKRAPLMIAYALVMIVAYWILGAPAYLIAALLLLAFSALALRKRKAPEALF